jgi:hypothetical protein
VITLCRADVPITAHLAIPLPQRQNPIVVTAAPAEQASGTTTGGTPVVPEGNG